MSQQQEQIDIESIDFTSIVQLRRALHRIGVSSSTPGLTGTKRMRELGKRVRQASGEIVPDSLCSSEFNNKSMMEIRQELIRHGLDTSTEGLKGQARRSCLIKRLMESKK